MRIKPKTLFLIDGLGALLSAFLLGVVLTRFESVFGMPCNILYLLSAIACMLAAYSLVQYFLVKNVREAHFRTIAWANLGYCCLTLGLVFSFYKNFTNLGFIYFAAECFVIIILAMFELNAAKHHRQSL